VTARAAAYWRGPRGIQQALHTAAVCHQAAMAALYAEHTAARREQR
jgi:hypothetical protein